MGGSKPPPPGPNASGEDEEVFESEGELEPGDR